MRRLATGLLLAMAALFVLTRSLEASQPGWGYVRAFAEAALIGALADWFAVVALFRHPLGLPIPHTAIVPLKKAQLGASLARFVTDNFLTRAALAPRLGAVDLAGAVATWLRQPGHAGLVAERLTGLVPGLLALFDEPALRRAVHRELAAQVDELDLGPLAARVLATLTEEDRHRTLLQEGLKAVDAWLRDNRDWVQDQLRAEIKLPDWRPLTGVRTGVAAYAADKLVQRVSQLVHEVGADPAHPFHAQFRARLDAEIIALQSSPAYAEKLQSIKTRLLDDPALGRYLEGIWDSLSAWVREDLARDDSALRRHLQHLIERLAGTLEAEPELRANLNLWLANGVATLAEHNRHHVAGFMREIVLAWDSADLARVLEHEVGRDLQFIRINGTLVGGLVGLVLHALGPLIWP